MDVLVDRPDLGAAAPVRGWRISQKLDAVLSRNPLRWKVLLLAILAGLAWKLRFVQDDAFITYRYSRNLARGEGLVFNPGERVEGYTNFLYAVIHAIPERLGWSTPMFSIVFGIGIFVVTLVLYMRVVEVLFSSRGFAFLAVVVLAGNVTFTAYATGGMETMTQTMLLMAVTLAVLPAVRDGSMLPPRRICVAGLLAGLAILTRMDSLAYLVGVFTAVAWRQRCLRESWKHAVMPIVASAGWALVVVGPWLLWKMACYGNILPNTFYAKSGSGALGPVLVGVVYVMCFMLSYGAFILVRRFKRYRGEFLAVPGVAALFAGLVPWFLYVVYVGADFMEYRFMVVPLPLMAVLAAFLLDRFTNTLAQLIVVVVLALFSVAHALPIENVIPVHSFEALRHWPRTGSTDWAALGEDLGRYFPGGADVEGQPTVALTQLGVVSYYSDLPTVDMLGLTDPWVARHGETMDVFVPGHVRVAPPEYL